MCGKEHDPAVDGKVSMLETGVELAGDRRVPGKKSNPTVTGGLIHLEPGVVFFVVCFGILVIANVLLGILVLLGIIVLPAGQYP